MWQNIVWWMWLYLPYVSKSVFSIKWYCAGYVWAPHIALRHLHHPMNINQWTRCCFKALESLSYFLIDIEGIKRLTPREVKHIKLLFKGKPQLLAAQFILAFSLNWIHKLKDRFPHDQKCRYTKWNIMCLGEAWCSCMPVWVKHVLAVFFF